MPISLNPLLPSTESALDRRRFLKTATLGVAAITLGRPLAHSANLHSASAAPPTWALLSDTHIHESVYEEHQGFNMSSNLLMTLGDVIKSRPSVSLINGDCARLDGQTGDYKTLLSLLEPLRRAGVPIHATLGNHDSRENFVGVLGESGEKLTKINRASVVDKYCEAFDQDGYRWILLDSLEAVNFTPGLLGNAQLEWVTRELDAAPEKPALLFLHHNVAGSASLAVKDHEQLLQVLRPRRQVKAVFFGHTHSWQRFVDHGIHLVNLPAVAYVFNAREPVGWVRATPQDDGINLELRSLDGHHPQHGKPLFLPWRTGTKTPQPL